MAITTTADGIELHWESRGSGPLVVLALSPLTYPAVYEPLVAELVDDHTVVTWDPRGTGASTRRGPYAVQTDGLDFAAVIEAAAAGAPEGGAVVFALPYGTDVALVAAAEQPELVRAVVAAGSVPVERERLAGSDSLTGSTSVPELLLTQARTDWRGLLYSMIATANPQLDEAGIRERVKGSAEYLPQDAAVARGEAWLAAETGIEERARALGDRLVLTRGGENAWVSPESFEIAQQVLPEAIVEDVADGPISRPDQTAAVVRRVAARVREAA